VRHSYERLARKRKLVRYDGRGSGLSDRDVADYSLDALMLDLEAVVDRTGLESFALWGVVDSGPVAIAYAARHPERVSHLILWCTYARGSDPLQLPETQGVLALLDKDWHLFTETFVHTMFGWFAGEQARRFAEFLRQSTTPEAVQAAWRAWAEFDVTALLPQVSCPTLVLHPRQIRWLTPDIARGLASRIPDARLTVLDETGILGHMTQTDAELRAIDEFLGQGEEGAAGLAPSGLVTILFTDMEGSTTLTQRLGDAKAQEMVRTHNTVVRDALKAHSGSETKHTGDGIMASFVSASRALECAIAVQRAFVQHNESADTPVRVRIGLNAGEPIAEEEDLFGTAVQLAARICAHAEPGQILASNVVQELAAGKDFAFADQGEVALKGFEKPVRLFEVRWRDGV
jgi:class 3 adenylate cyclase